MKKRAVFLMIGFIITAFLFYAVGWWHRGKVYRNSVNQMRYYSINDSLSLSDQQSDFIYYRKKLESLHPGLYKWHTKKEMSTLFDSIGNLLNKRVTRMQFYTYLSIINNRIGCSHSSVTTDDKFGTNRFLPLPIICIGNNYYSTCSGCQIPKGSKILSINGKDMETIVARLKIYNSADENDEFILRQMIPANFRIKYFLAYPEEQDFEIKYEEPVLHKTETTTLDGYLYDAILTPYWHPYLLHDVDYSFSLLKEKNTALLSLRTFTYDGAISQAAYEDFLANSFHLLAQNPQYKNLIIDLRNNAGGENENCYLLYSYLARQKFYEDSVSIMNKPVNADDHDYGGGVSSSELDSFRKVNYTIALDSEHLRNRLASIKMYDTQEYRFKGKIYLVTNANTGSASVRLASILKINEGVPVIGEQANGSYWGCSSYYVNTFYLSQSGFRFEIPLVAVKYNLVSHPYPLTGGLPPDYEVPLSVQDFMKGTDTQLEFIFRSLIKN